MCPMWEWQPDKDSNTGGIYIFLHVAGVVHGGWGVGGGGVPRLPPRSVLDPTLDPPTQIKEDLN